MGINPALADLEPLVGNWRMELYGAAFLPDPAARVAGSVNIDWVEGGAALVMRQGDSALPPAAVWIIGRDDARDDYSVLYADDRGVSRIYGMSFRNAHWRMWRDAPELSQRFYADVDLEREVISGRWEKSVDERASWEHDFNIDYVRTESPESAP
jgi:hypothetical protein